MSIVSRIIPGHKHKSCRTLTANGVLALTGGIKVARSVRTVAATSSSSAAAAVAGFGAPSGCPANSPGPAVCLLARPAETAPSRLTLARRVPTAARRPPRTCRNCARTIQAGRERAKEREREIEKKGGKKVSKDTGENRKKKSWGALLIAPAAT